MYLFLEKNNLLQDKQFGFRSKHSTTHALISLTESIKKCLDTKEIVSGIFIDLGKAKLCYYVPKKTMLSVYYALFYSHMTFGSLVWSLTTQKNLGSIFIFRKKYQNHKLHNF